MVLAVYHTIPCHAKCTPFGGVRTCWLRSVFHPGPRYHVHFSSVHGYRLIQMFPLSFNGTREVGFEAGRGVRVCGAAKHYMYIYKRGDEVVW